MINHIVELHTNLQKGTSVKIKVVEGYTTYINRTDVIRTNGGILEIYRANGAVVYINTAYVIMCCVVERL